MASWWEDEAFWDEFGPYFFTAERVSRSAAEVEAIVKILGVSRGASVLDLCCGIGRHSVEFARLGCKVTAVDLNPAFLERAQKRAARENVALEFIRSDMREFVRTGAFDGAVNLVTSFGYFEKQADDLKTLRNVYESLSSREHVS